MTDFYLVTGFLGAGKTTFLKKLIPLFSGHSVRIIVNEYGKESVDGPLLADTGIALTEVTGGSIFCSCRLDRFEEALKEILLAAPQILVVEASGLSDPTNIRRVLEMPEQEGKLCYKGCICLADAVSLEKVYSTARVCPRQLAISDLVLINKIDLATPDQLNRTRQLIADRCPLTAVHETCMGSVEAQWLAEMSPSRSVDDLFADRPDITLQRAQVTIDSRMTSYELERFIALFAEESCRIKGIVRLKDGVFLVDCVGTLLSVLPWEGTLLKDTNQLTILATAGMKLRKALKYAAEWYPEMVTIDFG